MSCKLSNCASLFELQDWLKNWQEALNNSNAYNKFQFELLGEISAFAEWKERYIRKAAGNSYALFLEGKEAVTYFAYLSIACTDETELFRASIKSTLDRLALMKPTTNRQLTSNSIEDILFELEFQISFCNKLLTERPAVFLQFDCISSRELMAYMPRIVGGKVMDDPILVYQENPNRSGHLEYSLLHELGHLVHTRLQKKENCIPQSVCNLDLAIIENHPELAIELPRERFANYFAMSIGRMIEAYMPVVEYPLNEDEILLLINYFKGLFSKIHN